MQADIYDFDKTIVRFDSGSKFVLYCFLHYPWCIVILPYMAVAFLLMLLKVISFTTFKETCFSFLPLIPKERAVKGFWDKYQSEINPWFYERERYSIVISASPDFLLEEISNRLGFDVLICTRHNKKTGAIIGENCLGKEKVNRLYQMFNADDLKIIDVYSDSLKHDKYIFELAKGTCYHIVNGDKIPFDFNKIYNNTETDV